MRRVSYDVLKLLPHNITSYEKIINAYQLGELFVAIVHATGTGKTYNALQLILDNPDKKFVYVTPYNSIIEHIKKIIEDIRKIYPEYTFDNVEFMTYNGLTKKSNAEIADIDADYLILDEFHHIGAEKWGEKVNVFIDSHEDLRVLGISAYTVRDRGTIYERDMVQSGGDEIFSDKVVSRYALVDAMLDNVLPKPIYRSTHINMESLIDKVKKMVDKNKLSEKEYSSIVKKLSDAKKLVQGKNEAKELFLKNIKSNGKYLYFCPPLAKEGINDIDSVMAEVKEWLIEAGYSLDDFILYKSVSKDGKVATENRDAFYNDVDFYGNDVGNKLQIMFTINQYNEGVHAPNIDGVILGRETKSDIVFFEQIGRALSVRGNTYETILTLQGMSLEEVQKIATDRGVRADYNNKEELIRKIVSPVIIDLADNIEYITELENSYRISAVKAKDGKRDTSLVSDTSLFAFDIEVIYHDLFTELMELKERFEHYTWEDSYELACNYYEANGDLNISRSFRTDDGVDYDLYGYRLGDWIADMRRNKKSLDEDKVSKLDSIGMIWRANYSWLEMYNILVYYLRTHDISELKYNTMFEGVKLGQWVTNQKSAKSRNELKPMKVDLLENLGIKWNVLKSWKDSYKLLCKYHAFYGNVKLPYLFKTKDGIHSDANGYGLYDWLRNQKTAYNNGELSEDRVSLLIKLGVTFEKKKVKKGLSPEEYRVVLKEYYDKYGNLSAKRGDKFYPTGFSEHVDVSRMVDRIKKKKANGKLDENEIKFYTNLGITWDVAVYKSWDEAYICAMDYYLEHGHLNVSTSYRTPDNFDLNNWLYIQRKNKDTLDENQIKKLNALEMIWDNESERKKVIDIVEANGMDYKKNKNVLLGISLFEIKAKVRYLQKHGYEISTEEGLHQIFMVSNEELIKLIGIDYHTLLVTYLPRKDKESYIKSLQK